MSKKQHAGKQEKNHWGAAGHRKGRTRGGPRFAALPWMVFGVVIVAAGAFIYLQLRPTASVAQINAAQAYQKYEAGAFFLDVRTEAEYASAHIAKSVLIPLDELAGRLEEVPRDEDVVVICRSGTRSKEGAAILRQAGFARISCLTGGLIAWQAARYPVEQ